MANIGLILRWIGAVCAAAIIFVIVLAAGALIWRATGADALGMVKGATAIAAAAAVLGGMMVVPRRQWKAAALTLWLLVSAGPLWFVLRDIVARHFSLMDFATFGYAALGGFVAYYLVRSGALGGRRINRVAGQHE